LLYHTGCSDGDDAIYFAVIADYGRGGDAEAAEAELIHSMNPDFIITAGDNNYPAGSADTIDENIGKYYSDYISPYHGAYGEGSFANRFFPSPGNHDMIENNGSAYFEYFSLPGNERYYDFVWGPVHFFALNSNSNEPDGITSFSRQAEWLAQTALSSTRPWKIAYFHHSPYSSGAVHGSTPEMQWDFASFGISVIFSGHDHVYERILRAGVHYFVVGICDEYLYDFAAPIDGSEFRYNETPAVLFVRADDENLKFYLYNIDGELVDRYEITH